MNLVNEGLGLDNLDKAALLNDVGVAGQAVRGLANGLVTGQLFPMLIWGAVCHLTNQAPWA